MRNEGGPDLDLRLMGGGVGGGTCIQQGRPQLLPWHVPADQSQRIQFRFDAEEGAEVKSPRTR